MGIDLRPSPLLEGYRLIAKYSFVGQESDSDLHSSTFGMNELPRRNFDFIWMSQLSYHLGDELMPKLFEQVASRMTSDSIFLFDALSLERVDPPGSTWERLYISFSFL